MNLNIYFKLTFILLLIPSMAIAHTDTSISKPSEEKSIKKSFNVSPNTTLKVSNSFGTIDVITWDKNRIDFDILIKVSGNNAEKVKEKINEINIEFAATPNFVSAITKISKNKSNWWSWGKKMSLQIEINYVIKIPITNNVDLSMDYGSINLDRLHGVAKIKCDYGKVTTKELMADNNIINFDYSNNCYFEYIKSGKITANYSGFTVAKTKDLIVKADYTKSIVEVAEHMQYNCDYGSLKIDNINNLEGRGDYLTLRLGNVFKNVKLNTNYGSLKIDRIASKAQNIDINSDYTGITIGYDANYEFNFNIDLDYASLRESEDFNFTSKEVNSSKKRYKGYYGSPDSNHIIKINSDYGSVTFKKN